MSQTVCIPCLNMKFYDHEYTIHRWSKAKCPECGNVRHGLLVSFTGQRTEVKDDSNSS